MLLYFALACQPDAVDLSDKADDTGTPADAESDGYRIPDNCDDTDASIHPGAEDPCHGVDRACDGGTENVGEYDGDLLFEEGMDVCSGYCALTIRGDLSVERETVADLTALPCVVAVEHGLVLLGDSELTSLRGLDALVSVGDELTIDTNPALTSLDGLGSGTFSGSLTITQNPLLASLDGLGGIRTVGDLTVRDNAALRTPSGLDGLTLVAGELDI